MIPIVTPAEMRAADDRAEVPFDELIGRAARSVARTALTLLGGAYGRRVLVVAGPGINGEDGRQAAAHLDRMGVRAEVVDLGETIDPRHLERADLIVDAGLGTGADIDRPFVGSTLADQLAAMGERRPPVLAVDLPSGLDGLTGEASPHAVASDSTVTFAALKPGQLIGAGPSLSGPITVADIGLDLGPVSTHLVEPSDVADWLRPRAPDAHKWTHSVWVIGGAPGMRGAAVLSTGAASRAGAGMVRLSSPGAGASELAAPIETVVSTLPATAWAESVIVDSARFGALVIGPGLGTDVGASVDLETVLKRATTPVVLDADGLAVLQQRPDLATESSAPLILTPHDGEASRLLGRSLGRDRFAEARTLAARTRSIVLLKGPTTLIADADGHVLAVDLGDQRLATAGTGDVLAGIIGALLCRGLTPMHAAAGGAAVHALAAGRCARDGLVASDLLDEIPHVLADLANERRDRSRATRGRGHRLP